MRRTVGRLVGYVTKNPLFLLIIGLCLLLSVATNLGGSYMMRDIINNFIYEGGTDFAGLFQSVLLLLAVYAVGWVATYFQSAFTVRLAQKGINRMRQELFEKLQKLPLSYFDRHTHGEVMSRFTNDVDNVQLMLEQSAVSLISSSLMFVGLVVLMVYINWVLFLVTAVILVLTMNVFKIFGGKGQTHYRQQQQALGQVNGNIQEMIEGLKVVKAFTHEDIATREFEALNENYRSAATSAAFYTSTIMPISGNLMNISYACTAAFGGLLAVLRGFDLGGLIIYLNYSKQIGQPLNQVSQQMTVVLSALAGAERVFQVMDMEPEVDEGSITLVPATKEGDTLIPCPQGGCNHWAWRVPKGGHIALVPTQGDTSHGWCYHGETHPIRGLVAEDENAYYCELRGAVRFKDVDFSYLPEKKILKNVSLYANPGQKIAFVGSTGAGKTTITNLVNRFYEIQSGVITYDGLDVTAIRKDDLRRSLGMVLQDTHLFTGSIMDNIRYGNLNASDEDCIRAAKQANAHSFIHRLPEGYHTHIEGDGGNLSQGQRQLLAIARAAVATPPVMILDEATSSIDTRTEKLIGEGMDALMAGRTVFVIAHRLSTIRNADCIVVIEGGEIVEKGNHAQLLEQQGRYYSLHTGQFKLT